MLQRDFRRFAMALTACAELYGKPVSEGAMSLWWQALERFDIEQIEAAFRRVIEDPEGGQFMPKPADLIKRLEGTATERSLIAWGKVLEAARVVGAYRSVVFDDGAIHAAISDLGGWPSVCRSDADELPFLQRRFCDAHRAYSTRHGLSFPSRLLGEHESANRHSGQPVAPPILVGDAQRAQAVALAGTSGPKTQFTQLADQLPAIQRISSAA